MQTHPTPPEEFAVQPIPFRTYEADDGIEMGSGTAISTTVSQDEYLHYADNAVVDDFGNLVPVDF